MAIVSDSNLISAAIEREVRARVKAAISEEVENSREAVAKAINAQADAIALSVLRTYDMSADVNRVIITVKKGER